MTDKPLSVLLLEDNGDDEHLALRALRQCGLAVSVEVARDGNEALRALGLEGPGDKSAPVLPDLVTPDLVISDLKMPKLNGDEVLRRARADARLRDVPYVIFSSSDEAADVRRCLEYGADAYCVKPVDFREYIECAVGIARRWLKRDAAPDTPRCAVETMDGTQALPGGSG